MATATKPRKDFDGRVWPTILDFNVNIDSQLTSKANFLFGASTLMFMYLVDKYLFSPITLTSIDYAAVLILLAGSFIAMVLELMVILPKIRLFQKKERVKEDVLYYKNIMNFYTREQYVRYLKDLPLDETRISKAYANQIYSLATHIIPYKFAMLKKAGWIQVFSLLVAVLLLLTGHFI